MAYEIVMLIVGVSIGFIIAWYIISKQKFGDKEEVLNSRWEKRIIQYEKEYEIKLEKANSLVEKLKEQNKTEQEKIAKEWQIRYIKDIEELKALFKESEKKIKQQSVSSSRRSLVGKFIEKFIPFLSQVPFEPADMHFLGQPIDYIVFEGSAEDDIKKVGFLEVKTGEGKLTKREKSLKEAIEKRNVYWKEIRIDTAEENVPDKEIENDKTSIDDIYTKIDSKLASAKAITVVAMTNQTGEDKDKKVYPKKLSEHKNKDKTEYDVLCPECQNQFTLELDEGDSLFEGVKIVCPHCKQDVIIENENIAIIKEA